MSHTPFSHRPAQPIDPPRLRVSASRVAPSCYVVGPFNSGAEAAEDLVRNRPDPRRHLSRVDGLPRLLALRAEEDDFIAGIDDVHVGDVDGQHVHAHRADDRRAAAADQHPPAAFEPSIEAVGISGRHDRERRRARGAEASAVADTLTLADALDRHHAARQRHHRRHSKRRRQWRRHEAVEQEDRDERSRTRPASRVAARRSWRRGATAACRQARRAGGWRARTTTAARRTTDPPGRRRRQSACGGPRARGWDWRATPAAFAAGCRGESRGGSCPCRSSGDTRASRLARRRPPAALGPRPGSKSSA